LVEFLIDEKKYEIEMNSLFSFGGKEILSNEETDPVFNQSWYKLGFKINDLFSKSELSLLYDGITKKICEISGKYFLLEDYHNNVDENLHFQIVSQTRDLFSKDFKFNTKKIVRKLEEFLGFKLTDKDPDTGKKLHIIVRINRPNSLDYNPPHKDIYQQYDETKIIPKCVNFWIPICGVNENSMLPLAPSSHLLSEEKIFRTFCGGVIYDKKYRVRSIASWGGSNKLFRPIIKPGQILCFSSHLIHGMAINENNCTRVALEFRLFKF
jgi:hypothetical protein